MYMTRDHEQERRERLRYSYLERLYLLTGPECERAVTTPEVEENLGLPPALVASLTEDLTRLGYLRWDTSGMRICITSAGVEYMQRRAWRRRTVRD